MSFTLLDIVGQIPAAVEDLAARRAPCCPCGKTSYRTKREAREALGGINRKMRHTMHAYCCGFGGDHYHIGHARGRS